MKGSAIFDIVWSHRQRHFKEAIQLLNKAIQEEKGEWGLYVNRGGEAERRACWE